MLEIQKYFEDLADFTCILVLLQTNTFQCVLATDGTNSFVIFLYDDIQWTTAEPRPLSSSGSGNRLSGSGHSELLSDTFPAQVGFNAGDGVSFATIPGSRTEAVLNLTSTSNVDVPGLWIYRVDSTVVSGGKN